MRNEERRLQAIIVLSLLVLTSLGLLAVAAHGDRTVTIIDGDDIIKNFEFEYYQPSKAGSDPFTNRYNIDNGKLQVSYGSWNIKDMRLTGAVEKGNNEVELSYIVTLDNRFYVYTAIPLTQASQTLGGWQTSTEREGGLSVFLYRRYGAFGDEFTQLRYGREINYYFYNFLDIASWNADKHIYSGSMRFNFDISGTPFLEILYDEDGTQYDPTFSHISLYKGFLVNGKWGYITTVNLQDQVIVADGETPSRHSFSTAEGIYVSEGGSNNKMIPWNAHPSISDPEVRLTWEDGVVVRGDHDKIDTTRRDGSKLWDPVNPTASTTDGAFILPIDRLTPLVTEYWRTLTYYRKSCYTTEDLLGTKTWYGNWEGVGELTTRMESSALKIENRYISYDVNLELNIVTNYQLDSLREVPKVGQPLEVYDKLIFSSGVAGAISGEFGIMKEPGLFDYLIFIIILIVIAVIAIAAVKLVRKKRKKGPEPPTIHVHTK